MTWNDLDFFKSADWVTVQNRLDYFDSTGRLYNPKRELLFAALDKTPFDEIKVAWIGQDPYPARKYATGVAYAIPNGSEKIPPTLSNIFKEYVNDTHFSIPTKTDLTKWTSEGVLLWNSIPSCFTGLSLSHDWPEWKALTSEIIKKLSDKKDIVFIFNGRRSRDFVYLVDEKDNTCIETSHPSPLSVGGFFGSRIFTRTNALLVDTHGKDPVNWEI